MLGEQRDVLGFKFRSCIISWIQKDTFFRKDRDANGKRGLERHTLGSCLPALGKAGWDSGRKMTGEWGRGHSWKNNSQMQGSVLGGICE
jgi:hypothetical protein